MNRSIVVGLLALLVCPVPSCAGAPREERGFYRDLAWAKWNQGLEHERRGEMDDALRLFREAIDEGPYEEAWGYYFGERFVAHAPLDRVVAYYRERVRTDPKPQTSHYFWGIALIRAGRIDEGVRRLEKALEVDPAHEASHVLLGDVARSRGDVDAAIEHYLTAVAIHPEFAAAHERLAATYASIGREEDAARHRRLAATSDPGTSRRFFYWGRFLLEKGRVEAAIAELEKAVEVDPDDDEARALLEEARSRLRD